MEKNDIKKALYKQKPIATVTHIKSGVVYYTAFLGDFTKIFFEVPVNDMGDASFKSQIEAQLLIRWISSWVKLEM